MITLSQTDASAPAQDRWIATTDKQRRLALDIRSQSVSLMKLSDRVVTPITVALARDTLERLRTMIDELEDEL